MSAVPRPRRRHDDTGAGLVDLLVGSVVLSVVLVTVGLALIAMIRTADRLTVTTDSADDARRAVDTVSRSLAAADLVNPPASVAGETWLEARTTAVPTGPGQCAQWRVGTDGTLRMRSWTVGSTSATAWTTVARGVANTAAEPVFTVLPADGGWTTGRVVLDLRLRRSRGGLVPASTVVALSNGAGDTGGVAPTPVCTELGRS